MRILRTVSLRRYRVEGSVPEPGSEAFLRRLRDRRFLPLKAHEERAHGWVSPSNLLVTEFDPEEVLAAGRAVLAFRIDRRRVSPRLLRARMDLEVRARWKAARDAGTPFRFPREERQQVRKGLEDEMRRETNPSVEAHAAIYDPRARSVAVLTLSRGANEVFRTLFQDTFDADLRLLTPARRAAELLEATPLLGALDALHRSEFRPGAGPAPRGRATAAAEASS